MLRQDTQSLV